MLVYFKKGTVREMPVHASVVGQRIVGIELRTRDLEALLAAEEAQRLAALRSWLDACTKTPTTIGE